MIIQQFIRSRFTKALISLLLAAQLVACGGGGSSSPAVISSSSQAAPSSPVPSSGSTSGGSTSGGGTSPVVTGSATLNWTAPVARADGSPLSLVDIGGYRVYYGTSSGNYPDSVDLNDGTAVQLTVSNLPVGTYYLVMTTYDVTGRESVFSPEVIKTI